MTPVRISLAAAVLALCCSASGGANADEAWVDTQLSDPELAELRGGTLVLDGLRIDVGVTMETLVDGQSIMRSGIGGDGFSVAGGSLPEGLTASTSINAAGGTTFLLSNTASNRTVEQFMNVTIDIGNFRQFGAAGNPAVLGMASLLRNGAIGALGH